MHAATRGSPFEEKKKVDQFTKWVKSSSRKGSGGPMCARRASSKASSLASSCMDAAMLCGMGSDVDVVFLKGSPERAVPCAAAPVDFFGKVGRHRGWNLGRVGTELSLAAAAAAAVPCAILVGEVAVPVAAEGSATATSAP